MNPHEIKTVRIDVPLQTLKAHLFLHPWDDTNPWSQALVTFVAQLLPDTAEWVRNETEGTLYAWVQMSNMQKTELMDIVRTAPEHLVARHRTLRRATKLPRDRDPEIRVMVFPQ